MRFQWSMLRETYSDWEEHDAQRLAAALAYYTILSLAPLVILLVAGLSLVFQHSSAQSHLLGEVEGLIGHQGAEAVRGLFIEHAQRPASGALASIISVLTLLVGAAGVFGELRSTLNTMWDVKLSNGSGLWAAIRERFFSFGMVLAIGFLLVISLAISIAVAALGKFFTDLLPLPEAALSCINIALSLLGTTVLFALIFKYVPETKIAWKDVWLGAAATAVLFTIGKFLIGLYLGKAAVGSSYGAAGSLIAVLVWIYYSANVFLFGAEFTHVLATHNASAAGEADPASIAA
jgi:membrane protein